MTLADGVWALTRESPDFTPLDFPQRFTGTFGADQTPSAAPRETSPADGGHGKHDFGLTYRRAAGGVAPGPAAQTARDMIEASRYLVLATADATGRRGLAGLLRAHRLHRFYWVSSPR